MSERGAEEFKVEVRNSFSLLSLLPEETIEEQWHSLRETWEATCAKVFGKKNKPKKKNTKSGLHLTPGKSLPRGRIKRPNQPDTGNRGKARTTSLILGED